MSRAIGRLSAGAVLAAAAVSIAVCVPPTAVRAAYRAFRNPSLLEPRPPPPPSAPLPPPPPPPTEARAPWIPESDVDRELAHAAPDDLDDPEGATLAALTLPDLRVPITRRTLRYVRFFARTEAGRRSFLGCYRRSLAHRDAVEQALRAAGLPLDLTWLPAIESGYDVRAVSPAGAAGLWQIMPETARALGLERSPFIDERFDAARATRAAVKHLRDLAQRFGRWDLALAAYNAGSGRIESAVEKLKRERGASETASRPVTFADLGAAHLLPDETASYVPQIMAFALVAINAEAFGIDVVGIPSPPELGELIVPEGTRLETIARAAGVTVDVIRDHNPALLSDRMPPGGGGKHVALPSDRIKHARDAFPALLDHEVVIANEGEEEAAAEEARAPEPTAADDSAAPIAGAPAEPSAPPPEAGELREPAEDGRIGGKRPRSFAEGSLLRPKPSASSPNADRPRPARASAGPAPIARLPAIAIAPRRKDPSERLDDAREGDDDAPAGPSTAAADPIEPLQLIELQNGILLRIRRDPEAPAIAITTRIATLDASEAADGDAAARRRAAGASEAKTVTRVGKADLAAGIDLAAARLRHALGDLAGADRSELRRRASAARKKKLKQSTYGRAWIALGEALFPPRHPLAGTVLGATSDPESLRDLLLADLLEAERTRARASLTVIGDVDDDRVRQLATERLSSITMMAPPPPAPRTSPMIFEAHVPAPRALYGWVVPAADPAEDAALRVAVAILDNPKTARLHRALVADAEVASSAEAKLELVAPGTWVVTIELTIAPGHDAIEAARALDAELGRLGSVGPEPADVAAAAAIVRARIDDDTASATSSAPVGAAALRRVVEPMRALDVRAKLEDVSANSVAALLRRVFSPSRRAVAITTPPSHRGGSR